MLQMDDQGLVNYDPRFIATSTHINNIPTDVRGLTFSRSPQQVTSVTLALQHCLLRHPCCYLFEGPQQGFTWSGMVKRPRSIHARRALTFGQRNTRQVFASRVSYTLDNSAAADSDWWLSRCT